MPRRIVQFSGKAIRTVLLGMLIVAGLALTLTHTRVGRDSLRRQLTAWFNANYAGTVEIGRLDGNLVQTLYFRDVNLLSPDGSLALAIDSMVVHPSWRDLLDQTFTVSSMELFRPVLMIARTSEHSWSFVEAFRRVSPDSAAEPSPWQFVSADLQIEDGVLQTINEGRKPEPVRRRHVFDYTNATASDIDLRATIDLGRGFKLVDVISLSARTVAPEELITAHGQAVLEGDRLSLGAFQLTVGGSDLAFDGSVRGFNPLSELSIEEVSDIELNLDVLPSILRMDDLKPFFPSLFVDDEITLRSSLSGPVNNLSINDLSISRHSSSVSLSGQLRGLPDTLLYELDFSPSQLFETDVSAILPTLSHPRYKEIELLEFDGRFSGGIEINGGDDQQTDWEAQCNMSFDSPAGRGVVEGSLGRFGAAWIFAGALETSGLDLGKTMANPAWSSTLNGRFSMQGAASSSFGTAKGRLDLSPSVISGRRIDLLSVDLSLDGQEWMADLAAFEDDTVLRASAWLDADSLNTRYQIDATVSNLDLARIVLNDRYLTDLDAELSLNGSGRSVHNSDLSGSLEILTGSIGSGEKRLDSLKTQTLFALSSQPDSNTVIQLSGDVIAADMRLGVDPSVFVSTTRYWIHALQRAIDDQLARSEELHTYRARAVGLTPNRAKAELSEMLTSRGYDPTFRGDIDVKLWRPDILLAFWPEREILPADLHFVGHALAGPDTLDLVAKADASGLAGSPVSAGAVAIELDLRANYDDLLLERAYMNLSAAASSAAIGAQKFDTIRTTLDYEQLRGTFLVSGLLAEEAGSLEVDGNVYLLSDRNRISLNRFLLGNEEYSWRNRPNRFI